VWKGPVWKGRSFAPIDALRHGFLHDIGVTNSGGRSKISAIVARAGFGGR
jgi:hypothetical protein